MGATTLTVGQLASHWHSVAVNVVNSDPAAPSISSWSSVESMLSMRNSTYSTGGSGPHTHTLDGASGSASSLPPYYVLAYIMRCA